MSRVPLTRRQSEILDFIREYLDNQGISPTLEEIAKAFGVSRVTIFGHIGELERKGLLTRPAKGTSRGIVLSDESPETLASTPQSSSALPILGTIAAGNPISAIEDGGSFTFEDMLPPHADVYVLKVQGNSMIEDAICDGDMVVVERRQDAHNGETVVAVLPDNEATLKRFYREPNRIRLQPANSEMQPIYVKEVEVHGVVIGVIRSLN
ncbi:MAG: transcriptional repressor LexA [Planctomycetota bacterium]|nr:transcriptional repressor LexA [Planctomycetota bacterium]